jgi:hypothetical protein
MSARPSEKVAVVGTVDPDANATGAVATDWIAVADFQQVMFVVMAGILVGTATLDFYVEEADTSTGANSATLASGTLNITQITTAGNDTQVIVNVDSESLSNTFTHVRGVLQVTTQTADSAVLALGLLPRYGPANDNDLASVAEIKNG